MTLAWHQFRYQSVGVVTSLVTHSLPQLTQSIFMFSVLEIIYVFVMLFCLCLCGVICVNELMDLFLVHLSGHGHMYILSFF